MRLVGQQLDGWVAPVGDAPLGFDYHEPTLAAYRRRLRALALALAEAVSAEQRTAAQRR